MNKIRTACLSCTLLFAAGAFAWQYPSGGSQQPMQQPQTQPSQPSQQPSQNPGAQPGAQPQQPQGQSAPGASRIDDQVQILATQLNLSPEQQAKVKTALEDQHSAAMQVVQDNSLQREDKIQKIHAIRENTIAKVRATLTSNEQKQKFEQMLQEQDMRMHQMQQQQQQQQEPSSRPSEPPPAQQPPAQKPPQF
jgi:hypothetical protein